VVELFGCNEFISSIAFKKCEIPVLKTKLR
jgi:hypothetical protein